MTGQVFRGRLTSAGQVLELPLSGPGSGTLRRALGGPACTTPRPSGEAATPEPAAPNAASSNPGPSNPGHVDVRLLHDVSADHFRTDRLAPVTRGASATADGRRVVLDDVGGSGYTQEWLVGSGGLAVSSRWAPDAAEALVAAGLPARRRALFGQVLLHYPALWWAGVRGLAPLHVSVLRIGSVSVLLAGPGGVGKSSLVARELAAGAVATCDNLGVTDGRVVHGLREPLRLPAAVAAEVGTDVGDERPGPRAAHGRRDRAWRGWMPSLAPDLVVVLRRGLREGLREVEPGVAARALVAGTFAAGELRRYWALQATLSLATGVGSGLPSTDAAATELTRRLPCLALDLGQSPGDPLRTLLAGPLAELSRATTAKAAS